MPDARKPWIITMTHGRFGEELVKSAEMIMGKLEDVYTLSLIEEMDPVELMTELDELLEAAPKGSMVLVDLFGGTPSNVASRKALDNDYIFLTGLNLPMFIEAEMTRYQNWHEGVKEKLQTISKDSVKDLNTLMKERKKENERNKNG